jgi:glycosyltransferase involved in cell wall biosynthesis
MRPTFIRKNRAVAVATWKPWKKGRAMLRAAVHTSMPLVVAGDGIEFRYMRSPDKARSRDFEPDGTRVWDNAIKAGVAYRGCVTEDERDKLLSSSRFMLDMSLRFNSGQLNRVVVEAMRFGAVPIIDPRFVGSLLVENFNYLPMLADDDPRDIGAALNKMSIIKPSVLDKIREANYDLVDMFSRRTAAMALVNLGLGKKAGHTYDKSPIVNHDKLAYGQASFKEIFGAR